MTPLFVGWCLPPWVESWMEMAYTSFSFNWSNEFSSNIIFLQLVKWIFFKLSFHPTPHYSCEEFSTGCFLLVKPCVVPKANQVWKKSVFKDLNAGQHLVKFHLDNTLRLPPLNDISWKTEELWLSSNRTPSLSSNQPVSTEHQVLLGSVEDIFCCLAWHNHTCWRVEYL